jgi:catechol 2,3-dioxygenase-like lactoylglutathione lyase family enzyme
MIERIDRLQIVVADRKAAAETYRRLLGAEVAREDRSSYLAARRTAMTVGASEIELCEPDGAGRAATALAERGEGLLSAGVAARDPKVVLARLEGLGLTPTVEDSQIYVEGSPGFGARFVVSPLVERPGGGSTAGSDGGPISFLYEVTVTLIGDWRAAAAWYTAIFGLDPRRFSAIESQRFGYRGTLTLFDPPQHLDRIELSQVVDSKSAMGRWVVRRGDSLYMAYVETHDLAGLIERLDASGARWTPRGQSRESERDGLWVHPSALHGLLLGVSRTSLAWAWSGRPTLVQPLD